MGNYISGHVLQDRVRQPLGGIQGRRIMGQDPGDPPQCVAVHVFVGLGGVLNPSLAQFLHLPEMPRRRVHVFFQQGDLGPHNQRVDDHGLGHHRLLGQRLGLIQLIQLHQHRRPP